MDDLCHCTDKEVGVRVLEGISANGYACCTALHRPLNHLQGRKIITARTTGNDHRDMTTGGDLTE